jgi:hypothetical protein
LSGDIRCEALRIEVDQEEALSPCLVGKASRKGWGEVTRGFARIREGAFEDQEICACCERNQGLGEIGIP